MWSSFHECFTVGVLGMRRRDRLQAQALQQWLDHARVGYTDRMIPVTAEIARVCASIQVPDRRRLSDALIAATAIHHRLTVVTRNERDFEIPRLRVLNPFSGG